MKYIFFLLAMALITPAEAAIKKSQSLVAPDESLLMKLKLPHKNRLLSLRKESNVIEKLNKVANDRRQSLQVRWRAITSMGELAPQQSKSYLENLLERKEWYLRNAAMIAMSNSQRPLVLKWSERLLSDRSLMVRTAAVQAIKKVNGIELQDLLWEKINHKQNFHKGKSLWIRKHIADVLSGFAYQGEEKKFLRLLLDRDKRLHPYAILALQRITGQKLAAERPLSAQRQAWIHFFKSKSSR